MQWLGLGPRPRYFYGWVIVAVMSVVGGWALGMGGSSIGLFIDPMREELGFSNAIFGWANTARMVLGATSGMILGRVLDRYGPRYLLALTGVGAGLLIILIGRIDHEWQLVGIFALLGLIGMQGNAPIYTGPAVAKWFVRQRPKAMGMLFVGTPAGLVVSFPLIQWLIDEFGWRDAWTIIGISGIAIIVPFSLIFLRRTPEDMGLRPDGDPPREDAAGRGPSDEYPWTRAEALRTVAFWRLTAVFSMHMFAAGAVGLFRFPHMIDNGIDPTIVAFAGAADGAASMVPALAMGIIVGRLGLQTVGVVAYVIFAAGIAFTTMATVPVMAFVGTMTWGVGFSLAMMLQNTYYPAFFGRRNIGAIRGASLSVTLAAGATAGPLTGFVADRTGGFEPIWWPIAGAIAFAGFLLATTKPPRVPVTSAPTEITPSGA